MVLEGGFVFQKAKLNVINIFLRLGKYLLCFQHFSADIQLAFIVLQAMANAIMQGEFPERIGQPECQACVIFGLILSQCVRSSYYHDTTLAYGS